MCILIVSNVDRLCKQFSVVENFGPFISVRFGLYFVLRTDFRLVVEAMAI